jgi:MFS transporter, Spinster family, sphingosine-1-phosphate transporter
MIRRPNAILALLTGLNFLNYLDRMLVAAVLPRIRADLHLSSFEAGLLATMFLLGYFLTAPIFGALADRGPRKGLIAFGVVVWSVATAASGLAGGLLAMLAARAVVGVGEASYATLAPTIIDDITPPEKKGKALSIFYVAMPLGAALGYVLGGMIEKHWGWRTVFFIGGGPGMLLAITCLWIEEPARKLATTRTAIVDSARALLRIPQFTRTVLGYCAHTAAIGAFSYWGPTFLESRYGLELHKADFWFGAVTVVAGAVGTIIGGQWADRTVRSYPAGATHDHHATRRGSNALLWICTLGVGIATPLCALAFLSPGAGLFFGAVFLVEVGLFMATAPLNAVLLRSVPPELRASSMALSIFAIHLFGDLWSPPVLGLLLDNLALVAAMMTLPLMLAVATWVWWPRAREAAEHLPSR